MACFSTLKNRVYLSRIYGMEEAPCSFRSEQVAKESTGHIPTPFLISVKELKQIYKGI